MNIYTYSDEDIMKVLQKSMDMIEEDKERAKYIYEIMLEKMRTDDGNLVVLSQMADRYLEQASRATDNILKLANVMAKLKAARENKKGGKGSDFKDILEELELAGSSPFMQKNAKTGEITVGEAPPETAPKDPKSAESVERSPEPVPEKPPAKIEKKKDKKSDEDEIKLETEFE